MILVKLAFTPDVLFAKLLDLDLTRRPLAERRALLGTSLRSADAVQLSESFNIPAKQMLELVRSRG